MIEAGKLYSMPPNFGAGRVGPTIYHDVESVTCVYETDRGALRKLIPSPFEITRDVIALSYVCNRECDWLAGQEYNLVAANVPVLYAGADGPLHGMFPLAVWENLCEPIISGREMNGVPKLFAETPPLRRAATQWIGTLSKNGKAFLDLAFTPDDAAPPPGALLGGGESQADEDGFTFLNWFAWRYLPQVNGTGGSIDEFVNFPQESKILALSPGRCSVRWTALDWTYAPAQAHVIAGIAALPVGDEVFSFRAKSISRLRPDLARALPRF